MSGELTVRQSDLAFLRETYRLIGHPTVARVHRAQQGGGFGDQNAHPFAWAVFRSIATTSLEYWA